MDESVGGSISHSSVGTAPITLKHVFGLKTGGLLSQTFGYLGISLDSIPCFVTMTRAC